MKTVRERPLADQADREAARRHLDQSISVEAGAGTGKTTLLLERILSLIRSQRATLEQIVAITFTEKAAGELKLRLRQLLEKAISDARQPETEILVQALRDLERAPISTIHSFCASLLRERPVEAGIDPNFEPLDEIGLELLFQELWEQWLGQQMEKKSGVLLRALTLGLNLDGIARLVRQVYDNRDLVPANPFPRPSHSLADFIESLERGAEQAWQLATSSCRNGEDLGFQSIQTLKEKVRELRGIPGERKEAILLRELEIRIQGNKQNWKPPSSCEAQKQILQKLSANLQSLKEAIRADLMADLLDWLKAFLQNIQEEKAKLGVLDFQDLLLSARNLLRDNKEVRRYFQEKIRYILVDEFQDTDPLQVEVVFFLAENGAQAERWEQVVIAPGRLFLVGDPKQSIYRFRRADIEIYEKARQNLTKEGESRRVTQNFRTVPSILSWVNRIFADLIQPSPKGHYQPPYISLVAHPDRKEIVAGQPGVILLPPPPTFDSQEASTSQAREAEAQSIAALIAEMVGDRSKGKWMLFDKQEEASRPVSYRDVAVLFPTLTGVEAYETALKDRGIPYRLEGGKEFYLRQEVRSFICCLKALDDPADEIALVAALRSPFFAFSDEEIFLFVSAGNRLNYLLPPEEPTDKFAQAFSRLRQLHEKRNSAPVSSTVAELLSQSKALEFSLLRHGGEQVAANLRKILEQARGFAKERQATFRRFVTWLESREEQGVREAESPWSEEGDENVKLLTIHKAKGLEFPVVFLANLASQRTRSQEFIPLRLQGSFELAMGSFKSLGYDSALEIERARMEAEDRRLLYVAATRARDHLVIPLFGNKRNKGFFHLLQGKLPPAEEMKTGSIVEGQFVVDRGSFDLPAPEKPPLRLELSEGKEGKDNPLPRRMKWKATLDSAREKASRGLSLLAPSSTASFGHLFSDSIDKGDELAVAKGVEGRAAIGLAFHGVMERLDLSSGGNLQALCRMKALEQSIPGKVEEIEALCKRCLGHPLMERVKNSKRFFREVPFSVSLEENIVEGKIDLLFEEEGGWVVVDYKTDAVSGEALEQRFQSYREQGSWYARALPQATGGKVQEVVFFFVRAGEVRSIEGNTIFC